MDPRSRPRRREQPARRAARGGHRDGRLLSALGSGRHEGRQVDRDRRDRRARACRSGGRRLRRESQERPGVHARSGTPPRCRRTLLSHRPDTGIRRPLFGEPSERRPDRAVEDGSPDIRRVHAELRRDGVEQHRRDLRRVAGRAQDGGVDQSGGAVERRRGSAVGRTRSQPHVRGAAARQRQRLSVRSARPPDRVAGVERFRRLRGEHRRPRHHEYQRASRFRPADVPREQLLLPARLPAGQRQARRPVPSHQGRGEAAGRPGPGPRRLLRPPRASAGVVEAGGVGRRSRPLRRPARRHPAALARRGTVCDRVEARRGGGCRRPSRSRGGDRARYRRRVHGEGVR